MCLIGKHEFITNTYKGTTKGCRQIIKCKYCNYEEKKRLAHRFSQQFNDPEKKCRIVKKCMICGYIKFLRDECEFRDFIDPEQKCKILKKCIICGYVKFLHDECEFEDSELIKERLCEYVNVKKCKFCRKEKREVVIRHEPPPSGTIKHNGYRCPVCNEWLYGETKPFELIVSPAGFSLPVHACDHVWGYSDNKKQCMHCKIILDI